MPDILDRYSIIDAATAQQRNKVDTVIQGMKEKQTIIPSDENKIVNIIATDIKVAPKGDYYTFTPYPTNLLCTIVPFYIVYLLR